MKPRRAAILTAVLAACATPSPRAAPPPEKEPSTVEYCLVHPTRVESGSATLMLPARFRDEVVVEGIQVDRTQESILARGSPVLRLKKLEIRARDRIDVRFEEGGDALLLTAGEVSVFRQKRGYWHEHRDFGYLVISNDRVTID